MWVGEPHLRIAGSLVLVYMRLTFAASELHTQGAITVKRGGGGGGRRGSKNDSLCSALCM